MTDGTGTGANLPDGVSMTALGVAWVRAGESERPDRLFDDPLAARFLAASGWEPRPLGELSGDETTTRAMLVLAQSVIVRTRFLDDVLADAWSGGCRQVVILGAGLDTRAFRLAWPAGSRCFELDLPAVLDFKERLCQEYHGRNVLISTHDVVVKILVADALGMNMDRINRIWVTNASISVIEYGEDLPYLVSLSEACHLGRLETIRERQKAI